MSVRFRVRNQPGLAMAVVLFLLITLALLTAAMVAAGSGATRLAMANAPAPEALQAGKAGLQVTQALLNQNELPLSTGPVYLAWPGSAPWVAGDAHADPWFTSLGGSTSPSSTPEAFPMPTAMQSVFMADLPGLQWVRLTPEQVPGTGTLRFFTPPHAAGTAATLLQVFQATAYVREGKTARMVVQELGWPQPIAPLNPGTGTFSAIMPAALTLVGDNPTYTLPHSNNWTVSGYDLSNPNAPPIVALGGSSDAGATVLVNQAVRPDATHYPGAAATAPNPSIVNAISAGMMSSALATVGGLQQLVGQIRAAANLECGGANQCPSSAGNGTGFLDAQAPRMTVIDGDYTLPVNGGGVLLVTGTLSVPNNIHWDGLLLAIGAGVINFSTGNGGGSPVVRGAVFAANPCANLTEETPDASTNLGNCHQMGSAVLNTFNGGGNGFIQFDSALINQDLFSSSLAHQDEPAGSGSSTGSGPEATVPGAWQVLSVSQFTPPN